MSSEAIKKAVGYKAAEFVENGMQIGIGTGTTVFYFIERLVQRCREGLKIHALPSSESSRRLAESGNIPLLEDNQTIALDLTVDGADEMDPMKRMIKGGGGALIREKIIAAMSREMVVIIEEKKLVPSLGRCKLPVEVIPFAKKATLHHIFKAGYRGEFRKKPDSSPFLTDNGNLIIDVHFESPRETPEVDHEILIHIPGVIDTGFFFNLAGRVVVGFADGQVIVKP